MKLHTEFKSLLVIIVALFSTGITMGSEGTTSVLVKADSCEIRETDRGHEVSVPDFGRLQVPGKPALPSRIFAIAVPPGAEVTEVRFTCLESTVLPGTYRIPPVNMAGIMSEEESESDRRAYEENIRTVYGSDDPYPSATGEMVRRAGYRKYNLVDVRVTPFTYQPRTGRLIYHKKIEVDIHYTLPEKRITIKDNLVRTEAIAKEIIFNYDQARSFHRDSENVKSRGLHDYVIITLPSLTAAVKPLVDWEISKNRTVRIVTTDWITANYTGVDLSERMRNFLRDKYPSGEWGIEDVLLVGKYADVPLRLVWQDVGYGKPKTDYYYAELSLPDSQSWDKDGDLLYGEDEDPIDFYTEVNVSRIPWSESATVKSICEKSVSYEQNNDPSFKKNILLLGSYVWMDTDLAVLMEVKSDPPWMSSWSTTRMYEQNSTCWSIYPCDIPLNHANVMSVLPTGKYAFVNYAGHGSPTSCHMKGHGAEAFITASDSTQLSNAYPAIMFANACSNSDPDHINIGMKMMKQGAVGFLGGTCVVYGLRAWDDPYDGNSSSLDYFFTIGVTSNDRSMAGAHQWAMRHMYTHGAWVRGPCKYQIPGWGSLFGNPNLRMGPLPALIIDYDEESVDEYMPPGPETVINIKIRPGTEQYMPGTGVLCYRLDPGDSYTDVALTPLGGDLFEAVIPSTEPGDEPEFYFRAQSSYGSTVYHPKNAPAEVLSFDVCIHVPRYEDDFETDRGWTVQNPYILDGAWERADPVGTEAQPEDDHTPSGTHCFVTGADGGGIDQNDLDGESYLTSPALDMAGDDPVVSFYLWMYHSLAGTEQPLEVHVSNDDGATWTWVMKAYNRTEWISRSFRISDYVTPTSTMRVRFLAFDNPNDSTVEALVDDFRVEHLDYEASLWANTYAISEVTGGSVEFSLDAGAVNGGRYYLVLGSLSGTLPGSPLPGGFADLPLNWDAFTDLALLLANSPLFMNFLNQLDMDGHATATLNAPPIPPGFAGLEMSFAYVLNNPFDFASNPVNIEIER